MKLWKFREKRICDIHSLIIFLTEITFKMIPVRYLWSCENPHIIKSRQKEAQSLDYALLLSNYTVLFKGTGPG